MSTVVEHLPKNGRMKLTMDRHTVGVGGGLTGVQYSLAILARHPYKNFARLETLTCIQHAGASRGYISYQQNILVRGLVFNAPA